MTPERACAADLLSRFNANGAETVEVPVLLPAETLLDLYGEDIRARAFLTDGPDGELVLRPDFTVPVVQRHMEHGASPARYAYAGTVFRRQESHPARPQEYLQVGIEIFGGDPARSDAEVFALIHGELAHLAPRVITGDVGVLTAAVRGLSASPARKGALLRHVWRPERFRALIERYAGRAPVPEGRARLIAHPDPMSEAGPEIGLRSRAEVARRVAALRADAAEPDLPGGEVALIDAILSLDAPSGAALSRLREVAAEMPSVASAVEGLARRLDALDARGIADLPFRGDHGRSTLEYYDGFVFTLLRPERGHPPLAAGGRYDALTRVLGQGAALPAVGGVIRPDVYLGGVR